jgi:hypothetical protein
MAVYYAAKILTLTVPLLRAPTPDFLRRLEERLMEVALKGRTMVEIEACVECLASSVGISTNLQFAKDALEKIYCM